VAGPASARAGHRQKTKENNEIKDNARKNQENDRKPYMF
jgi:hypothetical protein